MARALRLERAGAWYHVTSRGNERRAIYRDDVDRGHFCQLLAQAVERFRLVLHGYVLMDNHFHLVLETRQANLSLAMQWLNGSYSVWINRRHNRVGHLLQGRYKAVVVEQAGWGLALSRYVHLNPVRVGRLKLDKRARQRDAVGAVQGPDPTLVRQRLAELRSYRWSSYRAYIGLASVPAWLQTQRVLALGGPKGSASREECYRQYVESAVREGLPESPWDHLPGQVLLGGRQFVRRLLQGLKGDEREQGRLCQLEDRPKLAEVIKRVEELKGEPWDRFRDRYGDWGRDLVLYLGRRECGLKLRELGESVELAYVSVGSALKRFERRLSSDEALAKRLRAASQPAK